MSRKTASKLNFLEKVLGRLERMDTGGLQSVVQRLAHERRFLETLFNTIEDGILVADDRGRLQYHNQAAVQLLGIREGNVDGERVDDILPGLDWDHVRNLLTGPGESLYRTELEIQYPRPRFLRVYGAPLVSDSPMPTGVTFVLHDATEARQKTTEAVESERVHALTLLAASVAHEIGNPLNALHIHLQLLEREVRKVRRLAESQVPSRPIPKSAPGGRASRASGDSSRRTGTPDPLVDATDLQAIVHRMNSFLEVAQGEITRLDYIVTEFLQALRPSPPQFQATQLNTVIQDTLTLLQPELENRGIHGVLQLDGSLPEIHADPSQVKQVLVNLFKNAMQAMHRDGILSLSTGASPDSVWIRIQDTGCGIPPEQLNRIFQPYFTTKEKGSGLGLMIVQRIMRDHHGRIEIDSQLNQGTTFKIWFPRFERHPRLLPSTASPG